MMIQIGTLRTQDIVSTNYLEKSGLVNQTYENVLVNNLLSINRPSPGVK